MAPEVATTSATCSRSVGMCFDRMGGGVFSFLTVAESGSHTRKALFLGLNSFHPAGGTFFTTGGGGGGGFGIW